MKNGQNGKIKVVKSYNNHEFLNSPSARPIRVLSELIEPAARFRKYKIKDTVVFFGSARIPSRQVAVAKIKRLQAKIKRSKSISPELKAEYATAERELHMSRYYEEAAEFSERLTRYFKGLRKQGLNFMVCSGGGPGIMAAANYGAKKAGGKSIGLNISLPIAQYTNPYQSQDFAFEFHYFFIRKFWFFYLAKALIVFPGGYGTMDELFELLTLMQTGKSKKKMSVILYGGEYWREIVNFDKMVEWGTITKEDLKLFKIADTVDEAFDYLKKDLVRFCHRNRCKYKPSY